jgi:hypothetical protein
LTEKAPGVAPFLCLKGIAALTYARPTRAMGRGFWSECNV